LGLFSWMFGKESTEKSVDRYELITDLGEGFYEWNGNLYSSDIVRSCIRPKSRAVGKLIAKHIRDNSSGFKVNPDDHIRFLLEEPNPLMTGQVFQEKMATQLELNNNAFALIKKDDFGKATDIYPIPALSVDAVKSKSGELFLKFYFRTGEQLTVPYTDVIHLRQDFYGNELFGEAPGESLTSLMEVVNTTDQGVVKAIKNSVIIKWILKFKSVLKDEDVDTQVKKFVNNYMKIDSENGGAASSDPRYDLEQVKQDSFVPDDKQNKNVIERIYSFFNTNEKIVQSKFSEDEWNAYFESCIEPISMQLSGEYTRKVFTRTKRKAGNKIIFESSHLQYASMKTKLGLVQVVDRGGMTNNEWRRIFNMGPIEGGDKPIRRLDTALVSDKGGDKDGQNGAKGTDNSKD
jgi:HK97 family phage portal protein